VPLSSSTPTQRGDRAQFAAASFLACYSGNTLDAYRHDLRTFFQWAADHDLEVLEATRPHIEHYRQTLDQRGLAPSTIDRRLSTVCGFYKFAHIDGHVGSNPAQHVRRPKVHPRTGAGLDREGLGRFLFTAERVDRDHAALAMLLGLNGLRVSEACSTNIEDLNVERGHRTLAITGKPLLVDRRVDPEGPRGRPGATNPPPSRCRLESPARSTSSSANATKDRSCGEPTKPGSIGAPLTAGSHRSAAGPASGRCTPTCSEQRSSWPPSTPAYRSARVQLAARHADPRTTTVYDHRRENFDRHAAYVVVAYLAAG